MTRKQQFNNNVETTTLMKTNIMVKSMVALLAMTAAFTLTSCDDDDDASSLKVSKNSVTITVGKTDSVIVSNGTKPYTAKSSDAKTASAVVSNDTVRITAVKAGKAYITVTDKNKLSTAVTVTVK